jgi:hypothetical protein
MSAAIWSWHSGNHALVTPVPTPDGKVAFLAFPATFLRALGWNVDEDAMRRALPRFDEGPKIVASAKDADVKAAAAQAGQARGFDRQLRGR